MVSLDDIVQIFDLPVHQSIWAFAFGLQLRDSNPVGRGLIGVDDRWLFPTLQAIQSLAQKSLGCFGVARRRQVEVDRVAELSHRFHQPANSLTVVGANASAAVFQSPARISGPSDKRPVKKSCLDLNYAMVLAEFPGGFGDESHRSESIRECCHGI